MKAKLYDQKGNEVGTMSLPEEIFEREINPDLIHQVAVCMMANQRKAFAHTKDRSEVRGGGRKPWSQKGTGRARHGSIRSPIWIGGGITHGPRKEKKYKKKIPKRMKRLALFCALSGKLKDKELIFLDKLQIDQAKTRIMAEIIKNLRNKLSLEKGKILIALPQKNETIKKAVRNLPDVMVKDSKNLNILDLLNCKYLILLKDSVNVIKETFLRK